MPLSVSFINIIFFFIISTPASHGAEDNQNYTACKKSYECGKIKGIRYPFWGDGRPPLCGVEDFNLTCHPNEEYPTIVMGNLKFHVLDINHSAGKMTIARTDLLEDICKEQFPETTLNQPLLHYSPDNVNISLSHNCHSSLPPDHVSDHNYFTCPGEGGGINLLLPDSECGSRVEVQVLGEALDAFMWNQSTSVEELVNKGFGVEYREMEHFQDCKMCSDSGGMCGTDTTTHEPICFCRDGPQFFQCPKGGNKQLTAIIAKVISIVGAAILVIGAPLIFCLRKKISLFKSIFFWRKSTMANDNVEAFLKINGSLVPKRYSYSSIKKLTNSFQDELGKGGYGGVYKGKLLDGRLVAVKLLNETKGSNGEEFINEVASISRTSHVNIVSLVGYCFEGHKRALLYEYMPNGSLEKFIYNNKPQQGNNGLEWKTMHKIAVGVARGLEYLHRGCTTRIFHFDIKPHNILLDEEFCPKISDFGLAKLCPKKESIVSMLHARGTVGYIAPEVFSRHFGRVSHKADVYSYGMLVLEMIRGRENIGEYVKDTSDIYFPHSIYKKLKCDGDIGLCGIESEEDEKVARKMLLVGLCCIQANPLERPAINKVIEMLEGNLESLQVPPEPFLSLPLRSTIASSNIQISEENESSELELL